MWIAVIVIAVVVGLYFAMDRRRYTGGGAPGGAGAARPTQEVFRDPGTGRLMRVWVNDATGVREYREEPGEPPRQ